MEKVSKVVPFCDFFLSNYQDIFGGFCANDGGEIAEIRRANFTNVKQWILT